MARFAFDSRENHQKIEVNGTYALSIPAFTFAQTDTLNTHALGYFPNVRVYHDYSGDVWPVSENFWGTLKPDVRSSVYNTTGSLVMRSDNIEASAQSPTVRFQIYKDGDIVNNTSFSIFEKSERILGRFSGSFTATSGGTWSQTSFEHGLGEKCYPVIRWRDPDGIWFDQDLPNWNSDRSQLTNALGHCDDTNAYVAAYNSYGSDRTIEYEMILYKLEDNDEILFDSREATFTNFEEGEVDIVISGSLPTGVTTSFVGSIPHSEENTLGNLFLNKSEDPTREYALGMAPLNLLVGTSGSDANAVIRTEHNANQLDIYVDIRPSGGTVTANTVTWTFRYALFVA